MDTEIIQRIKADFPRANSEDIKILKEAAEESESTYRRTLLQMCMGYL